MLLMRHRYKTSRDTDLASAPPHCKREKRVRESRMWCRVL